MMIRAWSRSSLVLGLLSAIFMALLSVSALAADIRLAWTDTNPPAAQITKYTIKWGVSPGVYTSTKDIPAPNQQGTVTGLTPGTYYFVVTASNAWGESGPSNEVQTPPGLPVPVTITITIQITP